jgi:DNA/RNA-binding domain of Phe-tRNA-synthetase-like protein
MKKIIIDSELFDKFPDFKRGVIVIEYIKNSVLNEKIKKLLDEQIKQKAGQGLIENEFIKSWDEIYLKFGVNPNKFPPSIKSLLKRIDKGGFPFINSVVALFNYISIKYLIPCGGDDVDKIEGNLHLGFAKGSEIFVPLGSPEKENPEPGEIIYYDDKTQNVMCRRWNWRNGDFSKINPETKKIVINIDGVGAMTKEVILAARDEMAKLLIEYCSAKLTTDFLDQNKKELDIF